MGIKRLYVRVYYNGEHEMEESVSGDVVLYTDHEAALSAKDEEITQLRGQLAERDRVIAEWKEIADMWRDMADMDRPSWEIKATDQFAAQILAQPSHPEGDAAKAAGEGK